MPGANDNYGLAMTYKSLFFLLINILFFSGCVEDLKIRPTHYPVCVECILTGDDVQWLSLYRAGDLTDSEFVPISEAKVSISCNNNEGEVVEKHDFIYSDNGRWSCHFRPVSGQRYTLDIHVSSGESLTAKTLFPDSLIVESAFVQSYDDNVLKLEMPYPFRDVDFSSNQSYYDSIHQKGLRDISEVVSGHVFRIMGGTVSNLVVTSSGGHDYFSTNLPVESKLNAVQHVVFFDGDSELQWSTRLAGSLTGGLALIQWLHSFEGRPIFDGYCILPITEQYRNSTDIALTNMFRPTIIYPMVFDDWERQMDDFERFFSVLKLSEEKTSMEHFVVSDSLEDVLFLNVSDELIHYSNMVYDQVLHPNSASLDLIKKLYSNTSTYSSINGGLGIFGAYTKNVTKEFVR